MPGLNLSEPTIVEVKEAYVHGKKGDSVKVCVGDQVELFKKDDDFLNRYLGPGPCTITWLGQWRCGRDYLQVKSSNGNDLGVNASRFKIVS